MDLALLRLARISDAPDLVNVYYGAFEREKIKVARQENDITYMKNEIILEDSCTVVATNPKNPKQIVAFANYIRNQASLFVQGLFALENEYEAAKRLLGHTVLKAEFLGLPRIELDSSISAQGFYEHLGFVWQKDIETDGCRRYVLEVDKADKLRL